MAFDLLVDTTTQSAGVTRSHRHRMAAVLALACLATSMAVHAGEVFRCTIDGKVNYSDHPCAGSDSHPVDVVVSQGYAPVPPPAPPDPGTAPAAPVPGTAPAAPVPFTAPLRASRDAPPSAAPAESGASVRYDAAAEDLKQQCKSLDKQLRRNDSAARQRNSAAAMDALREDRLRIQDEQHELGC